MISNQLVYHMNQYLLPIVISFRVDGNVMSMLVAPRMQRWAVSASMQLPVWYTGPNLVERDQRIIQIARQSLTDCIQTVHWR
jgi:hypothetical protein